MSDVEDLPAEGPIGALGTGGSGWDALRSGDPALAEAYEGLVRAPRGGPLPPVVQELIGLAAASVCSGIDRDGIRAHVRAALAHGATNDHLREVIELVSIQGIHTVTMGTPLVLEEASAAGLPVPSSDGVEAQAVKAEFIERRGYWSPLWDALVAFDPMFLKAYLDYSSLPWERGTLEPKVRELVYIAINSVTTHLFADGLRVHVRNAFSHGATPDEIVHCFEIASTIGIRSALAALPIIEEEAGRAAAGPSRPGEAR